MAGAAGRGWDWRGPDRHGKAGQGKEWQAWLGPARHGTAWLGRAWQAWRGMDRQGPARHGRHGAERHGPAALGKAWRGKEWQAWNQQDRTRKAEQMSNAKQIRNRLMRRRLLLRQTFKHVEQFVPNYGVANWSALTGRKGFRLRFNDPCRNGREIVVRWKNDGVSITSEAGETLLNPNFVRVWITHEEFTEAICKLRSVRDAA
jgi:hypothetical protein